MPAFNALLSRLAFAQSFTGTLFLSIPWMTVNDCVCVSCRCHRKLCAPWCCHDRSNETLSTYHSLYFQPHWIFLFQGENIVAFYNSVTVDIFFHCHVVMLCSCPSQMLPNCYLNTLTQFTGFTHHTWTREPDARKPRLKYYVPSTRDTGIAVCVCDHDAATGGSIMFNCLQ